MWYCSISKAHECGQLNASTCTLRQIISSLEGVKILLIRAFDCFQLLISHDPLLAVAETRQNLAGVLIITGHIPGGTQHTYTCVHIPHVRENYRYCLF